jgi:hypothetical protein
MCDNHGSCSDGIAGKGTCSSYVDYAGPACQYSSAVHCNGYGAIVSYRESYTCSCHTGYMGSAFHLCDASLNYFSWSATEPCQYCLAGTAECRYGTCNVNTGACICSRGVVGGTCNSCQSGYWGPVVLLGICRQCSAATTCSGHGACLESGKSSGLCVCEVGYEGTACDTCSPGYTGYPNCVPCPGGLANLCSCHGTCDVLLGCECDTGYFGDACDDPFITGLNPTRGTLAGGDTLTLSGRFLSAHLPFTVTFSNQDGSGSSTDCHVETVKPVTCRTPSGVGFDARVDVQLTYGRGKQSNMMPFEFDLSGPHY